MLSATFTHWNQVYCSYGIPLNKNTADASASSGVAAEMRKPSENDRLALFKQCIHGPYLMCGSKVKA